MLARALKVSLVVGTALNLINSGDALLAGHWPKHAWKIPLTYVVPLLVSLYSSAAERRKSPASQTRLPKPSTPDAAALPRTSRRQTHRAPGR